MLSKQSNILIEGNILRWKSLYKCCDSVFEYIKDEKICEKERFLVRDCIFKYTKDF